MMMMIPFLNIRLISHHGNIEFRRLVASHNNYYNFQCPHYVWSAANSLPAI